MPQSKSKVEVVAILQDERSKMTMEEALGRISEMPGLLIRIERGEEGAKCG